MKQAGRGLLCFVRLVLACFDVAVARSIILCSPRIELIPSWASMLSSVFQILCFAMLCGRKALCIGFSQL